MVDLEEELAIWAAGLFDGEGSALISETGADESPGFSIVVKIATTDKELSDIIRKRWGGRLPAQQDTSKYGLAKHLVWSIEFSRQEALVFLKDIRQHIRTRKSRVDIIIEALEACKVLDDANNGRFKHVKGISETLEPFNTRLEPYESDLKKGAKKGSRQARSATPYADRVLLRLQEKEQTNKKILEFT